MSKNPNALLDEALSLPESERARIADALLRSLEPPPESNVEAAWRAEIRRRVDDLESGRVKGIPWSEVREELWGKLRGTSD